MQVLLNHAESFILLKKGKIIIKNTKKKVINISKGLCYIKNNNIKIFLIISRHFPRFSEILIY